MASPHQTRHWQLTDVANRIWLEDFSLGAGGDVKLAGSNKWSVKKFTFRGGRSDGVDVIEVDNGRLALSILPTRGMGIWRGKCDGLELGWNSPVALPVHPKFVNALDRGGIGWLAGFNEWICRCGLDANGPPELPGVTLHGRIANLPAQQLDVSISTDGPGEISVTGVVDEVSMFGPCLRLKSTVQTVAGSNRFRIVDEIVNLRGTPADLELLYHINTGPPFLEAGGRCVAPTIEIAPRDDRAAAGIDAYDTYAAPATDYTEQVYYYDLAADERGKTMALLRNAHGDKGLSLRFNKRELPCFALWKNTQAEKDGYVTGLEPATNYPNRKSFEREQKRVILLPPGGSHKIELEVVVHPTGQEVAAAEQEIAALQKKQEPRVHRTPRPGWSPTS